MAGITYNNNQHIIWEHLDIIWNHLESFGQHLDSFGQHLDNGLYTNDDTFNCARVLKQSENRSVPARARRSGYLTFCLCFFCTVFLINIILYHLLVYIIPYPVLAILTGYGPTLDVAPGCWVSFESPRDAGLSDTHQA